MRRTALRSALALAFAAVALEAMAADELGTLFTTPQERMRLDKLRRGETVAPAAEARAFPPAHKPSVTGYVQRSDGRDTVWIDGRPVVIASPDSRKLLDPTLVQPQEPMLRVERAGREKP